MDGVADRTEGQRCSAYLLRPNGQTVEGASIDVEGDKHGVRVNITKGNRVWELGCDADTARRLVWALHGAVMDAIHADSAGAISGGRHDAA